MIHKMNRQSYRQNPKNMPPLEPSRQPSQVQRPENCPHSLNVSFPGCVLFIFHPQTAPFRSHPSPIRKLYFSHGRNPSAKPNRPPSQPPHINPTSPCPVPYYDTYYYHHSTPLLPSPPPLRVGQVGFWTLLHYVWFYFAASLLLSSCERVSLSARLSASLLRSKYCDDDDDDDGPPVWYRTENPDSFSQARISIWFMLPLPFLHTKTHHHRWLLPTYLWRRDR